MGMKNSIFDVDIKGFRQLQEGKPKWFIIRELLANAIDEDISQCNIDMKFKYGKAYIKVEDNSSIGFRDLSDTFTLFKETYKREDVKKRGRFNFGEKQVLCLSDFARIITTTGGYEFEILKGTKKFLKRKRENGSEVYVEVRMTRDEFDECCKYCQHILVPPNINMILSIDGLVTNLFYKVPHLKFTTKLITEVKVDDKMKNVTRDTEVYLHKHNSSFIYEMGIPICEIDCPYSIDVQQKVPLSTDRDKVDSKYLKTLFAEVLNQTIDEIKENEVSDLWIRTGFTSERAAKETTKQIILKRFGENALIANPTDKYSMDEAISNNFNVVYGKEMSKEEWNVVKQYGLLVSTSSKFKTGSAEGNFLQDNELSKEQKAVAIFCKKVALEFLQLEIEVSFYNSPSATVKADFGKDQLRFNVAHFSAMEWFADTNGAIKQPLLNLIIHELGHSAGWHYEQSYHECITMLGSKLISRALSDSQWFQV